MKKITLAYYFLAIFIVSSMTSNCLASDFPTLVKTLKPSIVAIGTFQKTRSPAVNFSGTGFVVGDGLTVITNAHVVNGLSLLASDEIIGILTAKGESTEFRSAVVIAVDEEHDLARLKISGAPLPAMELGSPDKIAEGQAIAFTGFPLAAVLGFHPATHRGIISAITPVTKPTPDSKRLDAKVITQLRRSAYQVYQLDATAYPGNSGSPVYDPESGIVVGVINSVAIKGLKETAITNPSGISYAIPVNFVHELLMRK
ncbi:serine protease Do [Undibacterium sp. GrIS 1.8]|uniref:S1C family serine protease n=1 Tax=unclassified Undibacterium TaxID=2630295 RepID=UPI003391160F